MPAKYSASIRRRGFSDITAYVEATNEHEAKELFQQQYGERNVSFVKEVPRSNSDGHSSYDGLSDGFSEMRQLLKPIVVVIFVLAFGREGYKKYVQPLFNNTASAQEVIANVAQPQPTQEEVAAIGAPLTVDQRSESPEIETDFPAAEEQAAQPLETINPPELDAPVEPVPQLSKYLVTVSREGEQIEILHVSAKNTDDAKRILRDFRGNPSVLSIELPGE